MSTRKRRRKKSCRTEIIILLAKAPSLTKYAIARKTGMPDSTVHINVKWMEEAGLLEAGKKKPYRTGKQTAKYRLTLLGILFYLGFWVFVNRRGLSPKEAVREVIENYPKAKIN